VSYISWLDQSERDRRRTLDAVQALREQGTVDELGLGIIWEPLADLMFPGTSTIQTRARYFLIVPWVYRDLEQRRPLRRDAATVAREAELGLIKPLLEAADHEGTIGISAGRSLKRLPSEIYWRGLELWGIRRFHGSRDAYHRWLSASRPQGAIASREEGIEERSGWHAGVPPRPVDFPAGSGLRLSHSEAGFLQDRIRQRFPDGTLTWLVDRAKPSNVPFPWMHPQLGTLSEQQRRQVDHAESFSTVMRGAQLLYNTMLAEALGGRADLVELHRDALDAWRTHVAGESSRLARWDPADFWSLAISAGARVSPNTRLFIDSWVALVRRTDGSLVRSRDARQLIQGREFQMKRERARLSNHNALLRWSGESASAQIDFRWVRAQTIANDIIRGLHARA
jgi:Family of unknown function (DUF6361)